MIEENKRYLIKVEREYVYISDNLDHTPNDRIRFSGIRYLLPNIDASIQDIFAIDLSETRKMTIPFSRIVWYEEISENSNRRF